jgi:hypothetical protein
MTNTPVSQWRLMIESARWRPTTRGAAHQSVWCALCEASFIAGPDGPPTYVEELGAAQIRVCPKCERTLTVIP